MSEKKKPEASTLYVKPHKIKIGGEPHMLCMDLEATAALEDAGYDYADIVDIVTRISFKNYATLVWAGTRHEEGNDLTVEDIRRMSSIKEFMGNQAAIQAAVLNTLPGADEEDQESKKPEPEPGPAEKSPVE